MRQHLQLAALLDRRPTVTAADAALLEAPELLGDIRSWLSLVVCRGVVCPRHTVRAHVNDRRHREREVMEEGMLNIVGGVVALLHRQISVDGDRCRNAQLVAVPPHPSPAVTFCKRKGLR